MTAGQYNTQQFVQSQSGSINHQSMGENHVQTKRLPQAIIIGVKKGGTRALLEFLRAHPNVRATGPEPHFFDKYYERGLEWYRNLMPTSDPNQITIEKTPSYFITKEVPRRVFEMSSDMKLIVVVRDPVIRAISDYAQVTSRLKKFKSFEEMAFIDNNTQIIDTSWAVIRIGLYAKHLQRWLQVFPLEQFHFVSGENLIRNPGDEMLSVQSFLGLDPILTHKNFITNNTRGFPCVRKKTSGKGHCLEGNKGRPHPYVHPRVIERLREFYRPSNQKFYKLVGRSFDWP
ncbi:hypothetical protein FSP39_014134 [Pinctada imbricata]|uniref:Sulfotransferase domain-containing protein n=1 Tax=Pinctada imbricata TaxID=66713 RepID=A0AA89BTY5_PINIB|nr:hypothetical protein FSP39_014134 [Pinctada imbricata]